MRLERLIYESTATGSIGSLGNLAVILAESQHNNSRTGLTGALAAHRDRYIQVVEGQPEVLDGLLRRLEDDPRHKDIRLMHREPVEERLFAGWAMASARVTPELETSLDALMSERAPSPSWIVMALHEAVVGRAA